MTTIRSAAATAPSTSRPAPSDDAGRSFGRQSLLSLAGSATSAAMGLLFVVVIGRLLGDAGAGIVLQTVAVFMIALGVSRFGMDSAALWLLPRLDDDRSGFVAGTAWFLIAASGVAGSACAAVLLVGASTIERARPGDPVAGAITAAAWLLPAAAMLMTALAATRGLGGVAAYVWVGNVLLPALRPLAVAVAVGIGAGAVAAAVAWALPVLPALLLAVVVLAAQLRRAERAPGFFSSGLPAVATRYAMPRVLASSLEQALIWIGVVVVGAIAGPVAAGVYGAASRFAAAGMIVDSAIRVAVSPMFSRLQHRGAEAELVGVYRRATTWLVLFSTPVFVMLAVFAPFALSLLGPDFVAGSTTLAIMCAGAMVTLLAGNIHSVLLMGGRSGAAAVNKIVVVAVNVALILVLVPSFGIEGAAFAWAAAGLLDAALAAIEVRWLLGIRLPMAAGFYPLLIGLVAAGAPAILCRLLLGPTLVGLATALAIGAALFLCWCRADRGRLGLFGITRDNRERS